MRGKVLDGHFRRWSPRASASSENVILEPSVRQALQRHVIDYRQHMEAIKAAGEDPSRSIIMAGPPGCGKTSANRVGAVIAAGRHRGGREFDLLNVTGCAPSGTWSSEPTGCSSSETSMPLVVSLAVVTITSLGQLLELLDGLEGAGCVQVIATTNHLSKLDAALTARPGRFDRIINVGVPTARRPSRSCSIVHSTV